MPLPHFLSNYLFHPSSLLFERTVMSMYFLVCFMDSGLFVLLPIWLTSLRKKGELLLQLICPIRYYLSSTLYNGISSLSYHDLM